eukprot:CAMPEP_0170783548 /NCGR_PEP_ID=MMETSP0733-20121128/15610_1 /TAXON_ID=186038 /ORGANISM="Fragilariopsis kerguelensis, Strain L26-C5" /LENGTH=67 /DNA_ID=CAMNT_0011128299 /DNA_START=51 /DNA_END=251 /DNA_ORIENTATION=+
MGNSRIIIIATIFAGTVLLLPSSYVDAFTEDPIAITKKLEGFIDILSTHSSTSSVKKDGNDEQLQQL